MAVIAIGFRGLALYSIADSSRRYVVDFYSATDTYLYAASIGLL
jgi:hypothetical protein